MKLLKSMLMVGLLAGMGVGCASTKQVVPFPDQSNTTSDPNKARIYVMRHISKRCGMYSSTIWDGPLKIGSIGTSGYLCWEREPGETTIRVMMVTATPASLPMTCEKGRVYYVMNGVEIGNVGKSLLVPMSQDEGQKLLRTCKQPKQL